MKIFRKIQRPAKKILCAAVSLVLAMSLKIPASAAGTGNSFYCDTTADIIRSVGESYRFLVTPEVKEAKITYTVGNGKVLKTFAAQKPVSNPNGTETYCFGFQCCRRRHQQAYISI